MTLIKVEDEAGTYFKSIRPLPDQRKITEARREVANTILKHLKSKVDPKIHPYTYRLLKEYTNYA